MVATAAKMGIKVEWIDKVLGEIAAKRYHFALLQEAWKLRKRIEELESEKEEAEQRLGGINIEMVYKDYSTHTMSN